MLRPPSKQTLKRVSLLVGFWTLVSLFLTAQYYLVHLTEGAPFEERRVFWSAMGNYIWVFLTPVVVHLARRFPLGRRHLLRHVGMHVGFGAMVSLTSIALFVGMRWLALQLGDEPVYRFEQTEDGLQFLNAIRAVALRSLFMDLVFYSAIAAVVHALDYYRKYRARGIEAAQLETQLAQAQVQALRMQLHPHFLFNTLHAISSLMDDNVKTARRMLVDLGDFLRLSLDNAGTQEVTLEQELDFLERYLKIERVRFHDRLSVEMDIEDEALPALVPNLILQPLVENAIKHGIAPSASAGLVEIRAHREGDYLVLEVQDDGPGLRRQPAIREGIGLRNTRARLAGLYGTNHGFDLSDGRGLRVTLTIPFRTAEELAPSEALAVA